MRSIRWTHREIMGDGDMDIPLEEIDYACETVEEESAMTPIIFMTAYAAVVIVIIIAIITVSNSEVPIRPPPTTTTTTAMTMAT